MITRVRSGDVAAYEPLVRKYQDRIYTVIHRMVHNVEDARDLTQETFIQGYRALERFRFEAAFHTWLFRIAVNTVISYRRKRRPVAIGGVGLPGPDGAPGPTADPADEAPTPVEAAVLAERRQIVLDALNQLDPEFRDAIALRDLQGCSYQEMAQVLDCPVGTVKSRIHRARLALRDLLEPVLGSSD